MIFNFHLPSKNLVPFIKGYLEADCRHEGGDHTLFPNGYSGIFFNFGNYGKLVLEKEYTTPSVSIFGQIDRHFKILNEPGFYSIGVLLNPTVLSKLLREDMAPFKNKAFDGRLWQPELTTLHARLEEAPSIDQKITLLDQYFEKTLNTISRHTPVADSALQLIHQHANTPVRTIAAQLQISERHLEKQFKAAVGLTPKTYALIVRFKNVEQQLLRNSSPNWSLLDFADEYTYYDQNHFIKDFRRFTGHTPSDYLIKNFDMGRSYLVE